MRIRRTISLAAVVLAFSSNAQDVHLSQFYNSDHLLSPAKIGDYEGDYRVTGNYRNQWRQINDPISTYVLSFDKAFHYYSHEIDAGIMVVRDEFTGFGMVTNKIQLSGAYAYHLNGHTFRGGLQAGLVTRATDLSTQTFPVQWDYPNGSFNNTLPNQESGLRQSQAHLDVNTGVQWTRKFGRFDPAVGFALHHINRPKDSYFDPFVERLRMRKVFYVDSRYTLNSTVSLKPRVLMMWTAKANDMVLGTSISKRLTNVVMPEINAGIYYRHGVKREFDALIPTVGFRYRRFDLGFSYDVNLSSLSSPVDRKSTLEFSVIYTAPSSKPKYVVIPCSRY